MATAPGELGLRHARDRDLPFLSRLAAEPSVEPYLVPGSGEPERLRALVEEEPLGLFVILLPAGEPAGALALELVSHNSRICQLTRLMVDPGLRGRGVATDAVRLASRQAVVDHGFHRVQAEVYGDNVPSQSVFERAGFTREGTRRRAYWRREQWLDGVLYGLLAEELVADRAAQ